MESETWWCCGYEKPLDNKCSCGAVYEELVSPLLMHELEKGRPDHKRRINFDEYLEKRSNEMMSMSLAQLGKFREDLKKSLEFIHDRMKDSKSEGWIKFLRGRRKILTILMGRSKKRIKTINVVVYNGTPVNVAVKFVRIAAEELPINVFQRIYGLSMAGYEGDVLSIEAIKEFIEGGQGGKD